MIKRHAPPGFVIPNMWEGLPRGDLRSFPGAGRDRDAADPILSAEQCRPCRSRRLRDAAIENKATYATALASTRGDALLAAAAVPDGLTGPLSGSLGSGNGGILILGDLWKSDMAVSPSPATPAIAGRKDISRDLRNARLSFRLGQVGACGVVVELRLLGHLGEDGAAAAIAGVALRLVMIGLKLRQGTLAVDPVSLGAERDLAAAPKYLIADKAYDTESFRNWLASPEWLFSLSAVISAWIRMSPQPGFLWTE